MSIVNFFKYCAVLIVCTLLMVPWLMSEQKLSSDLQKKILESIINLDHSLSRVPYFDVEQSSNEESAGDVRPGEINIHLENKGFTPGSRYRLYRTLTGNPSVFMGDIVAAANGELLIKGFIKTFNQPLQLKNINMLITGHMLGEESAFTLMSEDGQRCLSAIAVPKPIIAHGADGITMRVRLWSKTADKILLQFSGLKPNEEFNLMSTRCSEIIHYKVKADAYGWFQYFTNPCVLGKQGGEGSFVIFRENGDYLKLNYLWGKEAIKTARVGLDNA